MDRTHVDSSNVASIGYDPDERILEVEFVSRSVYQYLNVPSAVFDAFMRAASKGAFFNQQIKDRYAARQIS